MRDRVKSEEYPDYARTVELCLATGPMKYRRFAKGMRIAINWFLCVTQLGFCCVYLVFVPKNTKQVLEHYSIDLDEKLIMTLILIPIILSCLLTNLKYLSYCSLIAGSCMVVGCAITLYYIFIDLPSPSERHAVGKLEDLPLFFGTAIFAFEGTNWMISVRRTKLDSFHTGVMLVSYWSNVQFRPFLFRHRHGASCPKCNEEAEGL